MQSVYGEIRTELCALAERSLGLTGSECRIQCPSRRGGVSSPIAFSLKKNASELAEALQRENLLHPAVLYGTPLVSGIEEDNGYLNFTFRTEAYEAMLSHLEAVLPAAVPVPLPVEGDSAGYAMWRMGVLARRAPAPMPQDDAVQRAFFLSLALEEPMTRRVREFRRREAADAFLNMSRHLPPRERMPMLSRCARTAGVMLRLFQLDEMEGF